MIIDTAILLIILIVVGVILSLVFGGWILVTTVRGIFGLFAGPSRQLTTATPDRRCSRRGCLASNPPEARFCRHCGSPLAPARRVPSRRAACW